MRSNKKSKKKIVTNPYNVVVMRAAHGQGYGGRARSSAEISVISARMQYPIAPADVLEADVQLVPAALLHVGLTV